MNSPSILPASRRIPQIHRRRYADFGEPVERRAPEPILILTAEPEAEPERAPVVPADEHRWFSAPEGSLLIVRHATEDLGPLKTAARLAGLQVLQAGTSEEALQILRGNECGIDLLLILSHPENSGSAGSLLRKSLAMDPGLHPMMMVDSGCVEEMRAGYAAGAVSILLHDNSTDRLTIFLRQSLSAAREGRRRDVRRRERLLRRAAHSRARRALRAFTSWMGAPAGHRRGAGRTALFTGAAALLIGWGLALVLEQHSRPGDQVEAMAIRFLERVHPAGASNPNGEAALQRWQALQQVGLTREANDVTRRYYQDHLQELRWQSHSRSSASPETIAVPPSVQPSSGQR